MTEEQFETGLCYVCKKPTSVFCDECNKWVCENHFKTIKISHDEEIDLCLECAKHVKPGVRVGGVIITQKMLPELED
ncbi:hypothetical protein JXA85_02395 [Candidatus Woesearchaeota archaeon]|nr:hypothetical protein [Candidatus Woesearchaeota archaeon]